MASREAAAAVPQPAGHYRGRFAPSPTGPLHAGSLVAALASWLDARAHGGRWLVRIEDVDGPRCVPGADRKLLCQLAELGLHPDEPPVWQSQRAGRYRSAFDRLRDDGQVYPCVCSRRDVENALRRRGRPARQDAETVYPGTCRPGLADPHGSAAWRLRCGDDAAPLRIHWTDRLLGAQTQDVTHDVGDFVVRRADGLWAYQLAVVVDDAAQGITHVVRGADLADNTPRQIHLQRLLGLPTPKFLHTPLVRGPDGAKLSKQHGAEPLDTREPVRVLRDAAGVLGLPAIDARESDAWLSAAVRAWAGMMVDTTGTAEAAPCIQPPQDCSTTTSRRARATKPASASK